ncbi:phosphopantetheine-binding protein [Pseudobutyrivibrio sp. MD2005]|uniref:phosphopantetheine-binding protein n=1 Tax=Pseudobutyrivibrio sp. MD2005 TaxID=1410616 RepID=UPI0004841AF3|nr:phosphopantetheine-binding protein [Pseudobutyrivibrio sp. MD2005]
MEKLLQILEDVRPDINFLVEEKLITDGILDSFDVITIVEELNKEFDIDIKPKYLTAENFNSIKNMTKLIDILSN